MAEGDAALKDRHPGAVGFPLDGVELQIVDAHGRETGQGVEGEVRARSQFMTKGYLNKCGRHGEVLPPGLVLSRRYRI